MLELLSAPPLDSLMEVGRLFKQDQRCEKLDLGIGTYRDANGHVAIMPAIKQAELALVETQSTKAYVGIEGDPVFCELLQREILGSTSAVLKDRIASIQAAGGTGGLRLAVELIARATPSTRVWVGLPTWPNHLPLIKAAGLTVETYPYYDSVRQGVDFGAMLKAFERAQRGDVVLLHGCCHNPTGADLDNAQWAALTDLVGERGLIPLVDMAYAGMAAGPEPDTAGARRMFSMAPEAFMSISCSKSFGLYRERTGVLLALTADTKELAIVRQSLGAIARLLWSNPPDHGAAVVRTILETGSLRAAWRDELERMRLRLVDMRWALADANVPGLDLGHLSRQHGLFAVLPIDFAAICRLREDHSVYVEEKGRINIAGLNPGNLDRFVAALGSLAR